jgi:transposase-like protein
MVSFLEVFGMGRKRNQFAKEYKVEAVRLIVDESRPISEVARKIGVARVYCIAGKEV